MAIGLSRRKGAASSARGSHAVFAERTRLLVVAVSIISLLAFLQREIPEEKVPIGEQTLSRIAPSHPKWTDAAVREEFQKALKKIEDAEIQHHPFDHFAVPNLFSDEFYKSLMEELPPPDQYKRAKYAGTKPVYKALHVAPDLKERSDHIQLPQSCFFKNPGSHEDVDIIQKRKKAGCWLETVQLHDLKSSEGRTLTVNEDATNYPLWVQAFRLVHSNNFTQTLYRKFATSTGIPAWKQQDISKQYAEQGYPSLRNSAALRIEPLNYHLTPHVDRYEKVVTWQFFHPESDELKDRNVGTMFYEVKSDWNNTFEMQELKNPAWLDYKFFKPVKEHPVIPNHFFSFAPNNHSWHGAAIDPTKMEGVSNNHARRTFLGFITTEHWKYHHFQGDDWAPTEYDI